MNLLRTTITLLLFIAIAPIASAQISGPTTYTQPLGIAMEGYPYPFPVHFMPLNIEGQDLRMAYMDLPATGTEKAVVVLLHGKNFYGAYWKDTALALAGAGYRVIMPDQIGFGKSSKPNIHYSFDLLATNTITLLDRLSIKKAVILGHSMGGMLAARVVRNFPDRCLALVFENPIGLEDYRFKVPPLSVEQVYKSEMAITDPGKYRQFIRNYVVDWKPEVFEPFVEVRMRVGWSGDYPKFAMAAAQTYEMIYQQPVCHEFPLIQVPTLVVIGQKDRTTLGRNFVSPEVLKTMGNYPELGKATAKAIPNSTLVELPNVGHIPHLEDPVEYHKILIDYLNKTVAK
jgi:pimeloyl-ACP methyl ester carboxylesterase